METFYPAGTTRWVVIPTAQRGRRYEFPLHPVFRIARLVIEDEAWIQMDRGAVREEIIARLENEPDYDPSDGDIISLDFVSDLRSSLQHPDYLRRPWAYNKWDDDDASSTSASSDEDDSQPPLDITPKDQAETVSETALCQGEDDTGSQASIAYFHSAQEGGSLGESDGEEDYCSENVSTRSPNTPQSADRASPTPSSIKSSESNESDHQVKLLQATWESLKLQFELLKQQVEPKDRERGEKRLGHKRRKISHPEPTTFDTQEVIVSETPDSEPLCPTNKSSPSKDDPDSLFESEEE